jgi:LuxR family transcriptional regulator, maltose regulon positive regulatory protein
MVGSPRLAKLSQPKVSGALIRERLFSRLDANLLAGAVWVCGPPGSGKTTLVSTFVEARDRPCIWYQMDSGDADPSSFFYYLGLAAPRTRTRLPLLTAEYLPDLLGFARRFFRNFYSHMAPGSLLVLDGYHELPEESPLHAALCVAAFEAPEGISLVAISRNGPPIALSRLRTHGGLAVLDWEALKLTREEVRSIAASERPLDEALVKTLHERCGGWVAGLRLMLQRTETGDEYLTLGGEGKLESVFEYFAAEVFARLPAETRDFLLHTAVLRTITMPVAGALTSSQHPAEVLDRLHHSHMFTERHDDGEAIYQYHTLFRQFLLKRVAVSLGSQALRSLQSRAAQVLAANRDRESAIPLFIAAGEWVSASRTIVDHAPSMLAQGRAQTVRDWIRTLPHFLVEGTPRLLYCLGAAEATAMPARARATLERAHSQFAADRNIAMQAITIAAIIETYYFEFDSYLGLEKWIAELHGLLLAGPSFPTHEAELRVYSLLQIAMTFRQPDHAFLPRCAEHVFALLGRRLEVNQRVTAAALLLTYCDWFVTERAYEVVSLVRPLLSSSGLSAFIHVWWLLAEVHHWRFLADEARMRSTMIQIQEVVAHSGLVTPEMPLLMIELWGTSGHAEMRGKQSIADKLALMVNPQRRQELLLYLMVLADWRLKCREVAASLEAALKGLELAEETGQVAQSVQGHAIVAIALTELGRCQEAWEHLELARDSLPDAGADKLRFQRLLIEAFIAKRNGNQSRTETSLQHALALGRERGYVDSFVWPPWMMSEVLAFALSNGIEIEYARRLIRIRRLTPSDGNAQDWPWPVRIRTLGQFSVLLDGAPLTFRGKAPKRPMELLKGLIARGGIGVDAQALWETLWPDSDGDAAANAFAMALHRLRKLLGDDAVVQLDDGKLSLNRDLCWLDLWTFESHCEAANSPAENAALDADRRLYRVLDLYRGHFLISETAQSWILPVRDRLRSKMLRAVQALAHAHEVAGRWDRATDVFRRGLDLDNLCEPLYQGLMACLLETGQNAEAYDVYRRCREVLSAAFGVSPSAHTEALRRRTAETGGATSASVTHR